MTQRLDGSTALITGAGRGLGGAIAVGRLAMALGHVQRDGLRCVQELVLRVAMSLQRFTRAIRPADVFDGCAIHIERLVPESEVVPFDPDSDSDSDPDFLPPTRRIWQNDI